MTTVTHMGALQAVLAVSRRRLLATEVNLEVVLTLKRSCATVQTFSPDSAMAPQTSSAAHLLESQPTLAVAATLLVMIMPATTPSAESIQQTLRLASTAWKVRALMWTRRNVLAKM